ncbi:hypothetical protein LF41_2599 [Lysobacter dokdonensis DS-58]|uniref:Uncharacterized protein n=1 Tax=Lysobacter dokdonensis DS-58 TaxID=1300345 RepID=A0A0A2WHM8_9GAMM|nr:hypothetical protein LF41_2599 [Lysobacter dokdonensis DS-58]
MQGLALRHGCFPNCCCGVPNAADRASPDPHSPRRRQAESYTARGPGRA